MLKNPNFIVEEVMQEPKEGPNEENIKEAEVDMKDVTPLNLKVEDMTPNERQLIIAIQCKAAGNHEMALKALEHIMNTTLDPLGNCHDPNLTLCR